MRLAVIGAGWAGLAAAIEHTSQGHVVTVFEASRTEGGRARAVQVTLPSGISMTLDNGQHILIGAYTESLRLMQRVGVDVEAALLRLPLILQFPDGAGLRLPDRAPPWDALLGIACAKGWSWGDKWALLSTAAAWRVRGFQCDAGTTVSQLCARLTPRLMRQFIEPLCVSALNTPAPQASGQVFLRVLQDSLFSGRGGSNLLLPRTDLGTLFPQAAVQWLRQQGTAVRTGQRVKHLQYQSDGRWQLTLAGAQHPDNDIPCATSDKAPHEAPFDHVILACPPWEASRLISTAVGLSLAQSQAAALWCACADALRHEAIATVYVFAPGVRLPRPMLALHCRPGSPAQFVFDRAQLGGPEGLLSLVVSASPPIARDELGRQVMEQAQHALGRFGVQQNLQLVQIIVEKRATFSCIANLQRPAPQVLPGLEAWGDYIQGPYPATLEGAVRGRA